MELRNLFGHVNFKYSSNKLYSVEKWKYITALSQTCELQSSKAAFTIALFAAVNHNYDHKQRNLNHRNTQIGSKSTNGKSHT